MVDFFTLPSAPAVQVNVYAVEPIIGVVSTEPVHGDPLLHAGIAAAGAGEILQRTPAAILEIFHESVDCAPLRTLVEVKEFMVGKVVGAAGVTVTVTGPHVPDVGLLIFVTVIVTV